MISNNKTKTVRFFKNNAKDKTQRRLKSGYTHACKAYLAMSALDEYRGIFRLLNKQQDMPSEED